MPQLKKMFGADAPLFAELLAGTSPNVRPDANFIMAEEAYRNFKAGKYDAQIKKFEEGLEKIKDGSWESWLAEEIKSGALKDPPVKPTESTFVNHWYEKFDLAPRKANGALYGISSKAVLKVLARKWLENTPGLKTQNFVQNLLGTGHEATIDVWANRTMRRLGYEGFRERWRILPLNDTGVSDPDFRFSQKAFRAAAEELGIQPDALQGALWFAEKQLWHDNGWARLSLGDYREEIAKRVAVEKEEPAGLQLELRPSREAPEAQFMYGLDQIIAMNEKAARRAGRAKVRSTTDHSSFTGNAERGVVIHSGAHRETQFLEGREAREFLKKALSIGKDQSKLDRLIEAKF